jgi:hypothetical protein
VIETEAVIDPEAVPPTPPSRQRRRAVVAGVTLLAVVAGAIAVAGGGRGSEPKPLALMAGNGAGFGAETMAARSGTPEPAIAPAQGAAADSRAAIYPYGGWGLKFEVEGQLPALPDHAPAWRVNGPALDRAAVTRIANALDVQGTPVQRDGGWFVEAADWTLSAYGGDAMGKGGAWYLSLYRNRFDAQPVDSAPAGPAISRAEAEQRLLDLLERMGAPRASWKAETTETDIGTGWACAAPAPGLNPEELKRMEAEKLRQLERENAASATAASPAAPASTPTAKPLPADGVASCPPPPPPVKGFTVALYPVLDGRRADWPTWNVTMRNDGRIENLSGSWVTFERAGDYKLRGVDAALKELQSPAVAYATDQPATAIEPAITPPPAQTSAGAIDPAPASAGAVEGSGAAGSAPSRMPLKDDAASSAAPDVAPCPPIPMPVEDGRTVSDDRAVSSMVACAPPAPQIVKITGVSLGLIQTSVFEDGKVRLALVPSYRFVGHFDNGMPWETSVIALHPDAIAPPPDYPIDEGFRRPGAGVTGVGKAVPPAPPSPQPAVVRD